MFFRQAAAYSGAYDLTPEDNGEHHIAALYVGSPGSVSVIAEDGSKATFAYLPEGSLLPLAIRTVCETGTTAGRLVGLLSDTAVEAATTAGDRLRAVRAA